MAPGLIDHAFVLLFALAIPVYTAAFWYPRMEAASRAGEETARRRAYVRTMVEEWVLAAAAVAIWLGARRPLAELGLGFEGGWPFAAGAVLTLLLVAGLHVQRLRVVRDAEARAELRRHVGNVASFLPRTPAELAGFQRLSITAGICEEVLYRGFLIWYFVELTVTGWQGQLLAVVGSALLFGFGHIYQGPVNAARVVFVGLVTGGLYVLTGSLWLPMLLHVFIDINSGRMIYEVLKADAPEAETVDATARPRSG